MYISIENRFGVNKLERKLIFSWNINKLKGTFFLLWRSMFLILNIKKNDDIHRYSGLSSIHARWRCIEYLNCWRFVNSCRMIIDTVWYSVTSITHISNCYRIHMITITLFTHSRLITRFVYKSNSTDVTGVAGNTYFYRATQSNPGFYLIIMLVIWLMLDIDTGYIFKYINNYCWDVLILDIHTGEISYIR
jgi:hypothetical protein